MYKNKILIISIFSIIFFSLFTIDKISSDNPSDPAYIHIGISDKDTSGCVECEEGGIFYSGGCKKCYQDSMIFYTKTISELNYYIGWSNDNSIFRGDSNCSGNKAFPNAIAKSNDDLWVEMIREDQKFTVTLYDDPNYQNIRDSQEIEMCSSPTELQYFRLTTEDGRPAGNGGKILGYIDDIKIWDNLSKTELNEFEKPATFIEDFSTCTDKTCGNKWHLEDENVLYVDKMQNNFYFNSQISASNDDAYYFLEKPLDNKKWILQFKFHIDEIIEHPHGKGVFQIEPEIRRNIFAIPPLILGIISIGFVHREQDDKNYKFLLMIGTTILIETLMILIIKEPILIKNYNFINIITWITPIITSCIILGTGIFYKKKGKLDYKNST